MWTFMIMGSLALAGTKPKADNPNQTSDTKEAYSTPAEAKPTPYVFGWMSYSEPAVKLRGGTTKDNPVTLATEPSTEWEALKATDSSTMAKDRRAILLAALRIQ